MDKHDVFVDKQKRTWISNLAAFQISSPADFSHMLFLVSSRRHCSSSSAPSTHPTVVITLLVTADIPTASVPSSGRRQTRASQGGHPRCQETGAEPQGPPTIKRICSKLSFIEVGSSCAAAPSQPPVRTALTGVPLQRHLTRTSTSVSTPGSFLRRSSSTDTRRSLPSGNGPAVGRDLVRKGVAQVCLEFYWLFTPLL